MQPLLVAVNSHMALWALFLQRLPGISAAAFIDDSYIWGHLNYIHWLAKA